jgi:CMP/dCMP kinase
MLPAMTHVNDIPKRGTVVVLDGPAGAGKSTLASRLAKRLGFPYINTGLMYRALAWRAIEEGVDPDDGGRLVQLAEDLDFSLGAGAVATLRIDGHEPDQALVSQEVEDVVSRVARHPQVRAVMRRVQRALGAHGCVMEGRDIGTVVFPDADVKFFLFAPPSLRARRRESERGGGEAVAERDAVDAKTNPLEPALDAHVLDTSVLSREDAFRKAAAIVDGALGTRSDRDGGSH